VLTSSVTVTKNILPSQVNLKNKPSEHDSKVSLPETFFLP
jgi:hypothetical protein